MKKSERIAILEEKVAVLERRLDFTPTQKKQELEVGKWYKGFNGSLCFFSKIEDDGHTAYGYGFSSDGKWMDEQVLPGLIHSPNYCAPAPIKEVHNALEAEARERGLVRDAVIKSMTSEDGGLETLEGNYHFSRYPSHFNLGRNPILCEGVWAEPEEAEPELKVGKWYTFAWFDRPSEIRGVYLISKIEEDKVWVDYGVNIADNRWQGYSWFNKTHSWTEATPQEVEEALIEEAKRRGFLKVGTKFLSEVDGGKERAVDNFINHDKTTNEIFLKWHNGALWYWNGIKSYRGLCSNPYIFSKGKWATIIEDKLAKLKEAHRNGAVIQARAIGWNEWHDDQNPTWESNYEYRIKPEEKPKVGDVCKFWNGSTQESDGFIISKLETIHYGDDIISPYKAECGGMWFRCAKTITKEEAIKLLFGED